MIWFVRVALARPYTFVVMALAIFAFGILAVLRTPADILPDIKIPVIAVVWTYAGLPPADMSGRIVYYYERQLSNSVNDIEHVESQSLAGIAVVKIFFQPDVDIRTATAQVTSISQTVLKYLPPGVTPPRSSTTTPRRCRSSSSRCPATSYRSRYWVISPPTSSVRA